MPQARMEHPALPLNYYCRSARLCLKKADFSRKAGLFADELLHLKKFVTLVLGTIPSHPNYNIHRGEPNITELQIMLVGVENRIKDFEGEFQRRPRKIVTSKTAKPAKSAASTTRAASMKSRVGGQVQVEQVPRKSKKTVKKKAKKRPAWDSDSRIGVAETGVCKCCGRSSPSLLRRAFETRRSTSPPVARRLTPEDRRSLSASPRKLTSPAQKFLESVCASCRDNDTDSSYWGLGSPDRTGDLLPRRTVSSSRRPRESSGSPISRALAPLEEEHVNLQALVLELKGSFEAFKLRFEEEGRLWRGRTDALEKDVKYWKHDTERDLNAIRKSIQDEVKKNLEELTKDLAAAEDLWALNEAQKKERLDNEMYRSSAELEEFKEKINFSFLEAKALLVRTVDEKIASCMGNVKSGLKSDFDIIEMGLSRDVDELRRELTAKCESFLTEVELAELGGKQRIESIAKEALEKFLPQKVENLVAKEKTLADMKEALCLLWKEVESLTKQRKEERSSGGGGGNEDGERSLSLRISYESAAEEQPRTTRRSLETAEVRRGLLRQAVERMQPENETGTSTEVNGPDVKEELRALWSEVESLSKGKKDAHVKDELRALWSEVESLSREKNRGREGVEVEDKDKGHMKKQLQFVRKEAMQARVDAEDVRKDCSSLRQNVEVLEHKLCHLDAFPNGLCDLDEMRSRMEAAMAVISKEKELAVIAASEAAEASSKARKLVEEIMEDVIGSEKVKARRQSFEFQKSLAQEKDIVAETAGALLSEVKQKSLHLQESLEQDIYKVKDSFASEVRKMSFDLSQEKACAVAAASEVMNKTQEFHRNLRDAFQELERERDAATMAASEITALAERAEGLLDKMTKCKSDKSLGLKEAMLRVETELDFQGREELLVRNLTILEARVKETSTEQVAMKERLSETGKRVRKLEAAQSTVVRSLDEVRAATTGLEKSAALLVPQLEEAAGTLKDVDNRVCALENPHTHRKKRNATVPMFQKALDGAAVALDTKIIMLEKRIDQVASTSYTNISVLDGKVEKLSIGVQTALDGMTATENKCSTLGEEVVKVFRTILAARAEAKTNSNTGSKSGSNAIVNNSRTRGRFNGSNNSSLVGHPATKCICCSGANRWISPYQWNEHARNCPHAEKKEVRKINLRLNSEGCAIRSESPLQCTIRRSQSPPKPPPSPLKQNQVMGLLLDALTDEKSKQQQRETTTTPTVAGGEDTMVTTVSPSVEDVSVPSSGASPETRHTNVRLETGGRIRLNLRRH